MAVEYRFADNHNDRLPAMAQELVRRAVAVVVANDPAAVPAKAATTSIPIVFAIGFDPVQFGLVASLNHPGGNLTGVINLFDEIGPKRLELVHELVPAVTTIAVLLNPSYPTSEQQLRGLKAAAQTFGLQLHILYASSDHDLDGTFAKLVQLQAGALVIGNDPFFNSRSVRLGSLSARHTVPAIFQTRDFVTAGGLISYGLNIAASYRLAGGYTARILKGERPSDLPIQRSDKVELIINQKAAKALSLEVPMALLMRVDEVIE